MQGSGREGKADKELERPRAAHKKGRKVRTEGDGMKEGKGEIENEKYGKRKEEKG